MYSQLVGAFESDFPEISLGQASVLPSFCCAEIKLSLIVGALLPTINVYVSTYI